MMQKKEPQRFGSLRRALSALVAGHRVGASVSAITRPSSGQERRQVHPASADNAIVITSAGRVFFMACLLTKTLNAPAISREEPSRASL